MPRATLNKVLCLPRSVIGILPHDDDFDLVKRCVTKGVKNCSSGGKDLLRFFSSSEKAFRFWM